MRRVSPTVPALAAFAALGVFWGIWSAVLPAVSRSLAIGDDALGLARLGVAGGAMPTMLLAGRLTDRFGGALLAPVVALFGIASALPGLAQGSVSLGVLLLLVGATSGGLDVVMNAVSTQIEAAHRVRVLHFAHASFSASLFACSVLAGLAREAGQAYAQILMIGALVILVLALFAHLTMRPLPPTRASAPTRAAPRADRAALPLVIVLGGVCGLAYLVENGLQLWSAQQLERNLGGSPAIAGLGPGVFSASAVVGRLAGGQLAAAIGDRRLLVLAGLAAAVASLAFALAESWPVGLLALAVAGAAISVAAPSIFSIAGRNAPELKRGAVVSHVATLAYLGFLIGPAFLGLVSQAVGLRGAIVTIGGVAVALALAAALVLPKTPSPAQHRPAA